MTFRFWCAGILAIAALLGGCEYVLSDVATRVRYALLDAERELNSGKQDQVVIDIRPDHLPDACPGDQGYRLVLSPYKGNKQVAVGDITVNCHSGKTYYTGFGSERIHIAREMSVDKKPDESVRITLRKTASGVEIARLE